MADVIVDVAWIVSQFVVPVVVPVVSTLSIWAAHRLVKFLGLKIDATQRALIDTALTNAVAYGAQRVAQTTPDKITLNVKNAVVAEAASYALQHIPDTLAHFDITPQKLAMLIEARIVPADPLKTP